MSAYASLLNIDLSLPQKLASYVAASISDDAKAKKAHEDALLELVESRDTKGLITKVFESIDNILVHALSEEGTVCRAILAT